MFKELFILDDSDQPIPATNIEYLAWAEKFKPEERCALGKRLIWEFFSGVSIQTYFSVVPLGHHGRSPQLWITIASGPDYYRERLYSSHRAAMSGHRKEIREHAKGNASIAA